MNAALFRRLVWKEYRVMRGFWLALAAFAGMSFLGVWCFAERPDGLILGMWKIAAVVPALYALGCGATLFAIEREEETYDFLRTLPCTSAQVFIGKLAVALVSTLALVALLVFVAASAAAWQAPRDGLDELAAMWGVGLVEALVWGAFFSLLTRRPMQATVLAAATIVIAVQTVINLNMANPATYAAVRWWRLGVAAVVLLCDVWLGLRWLDGGPYRAHRLVDWAGTAAVNWRRSWAGAARTIATQRRRASPTGWWTGFGRLCWHEARQARTLGLILAGATAAVTLVPRSDPGTILLAVLPLALMGGCVFLADQERERFRFFAERGISPRTVWLSRQIVWLAILLLATFLLLALINLCAAWTSSKAVAPFTFHNLVEVGLVLALSYAAGQLASMYIRRGIIACFGGLWLAGLFGCWAALMLYIQANWLWSIAPVPVAALFATWLRAPDWILERKDWRARTRAASLLVPAAALFAAVVVFRIIQVPFAPRPITAVEAPATPEALETATMYRRAAEMLTPAGGLRRWMQGTESFEPVEPAMALAVEASRRESCAMDDVTWLELRSDYDRDCDRAMSLAFYLRCHAAVLQREDKLDDALSRYMAVLRIARHLRQQSRLVAVVTAGQLERDVLNELPAWAGSQGQTPARIKGAIGELTAIIDRFPSPSLALEGEYESVRQLIASEPAAWPVETDQERWIIAAARWMPWERTRARRLLDRMAEEDRAGLFRVLTALRANEPVPPVLQFARDEQTMECLRTTFLVGGIYGSAAGLASLECELGTRRRATRLVLALVAYRLEHGKLPEALSDVRPEGELRDPYTGLPFFYLREGLASDLVISTRGETLMAGVPLILSPGPILPAVYDRKRQVEYLAELVGKRPLYAGGTKEIGRYALFFPLPAGP
ncbi:MAG TPA: hypothetical protein VMV69_13880 [Pirellulales bacterium]|nr:hypothetical protein [Pirellulales bacterium]